MMTQLEALQEAIGIYSTTLESANPYSEAAKIADEAIPKLYDLEKRLIKEQQSRLKNNRIKRALKIAKEKR